jgi:hypothetical protein
MAATASFAACMTFDGGDFQIPLPLGEGRVRGFVFAGFALTPTLSRRERESF